MNKLKQGRKFSRKTGERKAMLKTLAGSVLLKEKVKTTEAKAKEARSLVEKAITSSKKGGLVTRRLLAKSLCAKAAEKLVKELGPRYKDRQGGYTRITKLGPRKIDGARMAIIELIK
ncbi:MAG: 50S ribosomal protein L17 [Patescibacteria group bacterium]